MGGDHAPREMLLGVVAAKKEYGEEYILVGRETELVSNANELGIELDGFEIVNADDVITMDDDPMSIRRKSESSMSKGLRMLSEGKGDAFVSCGNTGALFTGATLIVKRAKGVHRAAIAAMMPFNPPMLLLDAGANISVTPEYILQFAIMGSAYMHKLYGIESPRVGLLNNGTEESKGTPLQLEAYKALKDASEKGLGINFVGNVEAGSTPFDVCDVLVTDGFTGNVMLKSMEGLGRLVKGKLKAMFTTPIGVLGALTVKKSLKQFKKDFDVTEHGGSPILGISKPVIKAHGSSNAKAFKNAIRQAINYTSASLIEDISRASLDYEEILKKEKETNA